MAIKIKTFNTFTLIPIGLVDFKFKSDFRKDRTRMQIWINDLTIYHRTDRKIDKDTEKALHKLMKEAKTDLLTDGLVFYTTRGDKLNQINHPQFEAIKALHDDEVKELLYG